MVYGMIDQKSRNWYTSIREVFDAINDRQLQYNWLITDSEILAKTEKLDALNTKQGFLYTNGTLTPIEAPEYCFLSGEELTEIVRADDSQWIWAVLSGFECSISLNEILKYPFPSSDGYKGFWKNPLSIQHPLASIEIVPWDSSLVLFFSREKEYAELFKAAFPKSMDLIEYNA